MPSTFLCFDNWTVVVSAIFDSPIAMSYRPNMRILAVLACVFVPSLAWADPRVIPAERLREIRILGKAGELIVRASADRVVEADLTDPDAKIEEKDGVLEVRFEKGYAEFRIPLRSNLTVETQKVSVELSGRYGRLSAKNADGDVSMTVEAAEVDVVVGRGDVSCAGVTSKLSIVTRQGDVEVSGLSESTRIEAPAGEIRVERPPHALEVVGGTGLVTLNGRFESKSTATIQTTTGRVVVTAGGAEGLKVAGTSESGQIFFPEQAPQKSKGSYVRGKGSTELRITTVSGAIHVED
ncbi:MAG: DUF4097 family beta strand repeat protein [Deltaproteobacteria bacterium]|nr:DUF4097 family beta strand repeat protein [Deltaproteobacteria bacterium]